MQSPPPSQLQLAELHLNVQVAPASHRIEQLDCVHWMSQLVPPGQMKVQAF